MGKKVQEVFGEWNSMIDKNKLPMMKICKPSGDVTIDPKDFKISVDMGGTDRSILSAIDSRTDITLSQSVVDDVRDRLLKDVDFVNTVRKGSAPPFKMTTLGKELENRLSKIEGRMMRLEMKFGEVTSKIDMFLRSFKLPD